MASQVVNGSHNDGQNQVFSIIGVLGTLGTADVGGTALTLPISVDGLTGAIHVKTLRGLPFPTYTKGTVTYPDGTTEVYTLANGTIPVGTITLVYLDAAKGSLSTFTLA